MRYAAAFGFCQTFLLGATLLAAEPEGQLRLSVSWGHRTPSVAPFYVKLVGHGTTLSGPAEQQFEAGDGFRDGAWETRAGGGDVDGVQLTLRYPETPARAIEKLHPLWGSLIAQSDADTARRLRSDPAYRLDPRKLTVQMNAEGTKGFTVTVDQLLVNGAFWVPSLDVYLATRDRPASFADHQKELASWRGERVLEQVHQEPEATYELYISRWEDMGSPSYVHPAQPAPGHIVCLTWDSAIPKFGIDRGAGVWNDYGNPDRFRFWFDFGDLASGIAQSWKGQRLADGFPVVITVLEKDFVRYEVEQFAYPLNGPPSERRGDIPMVLLQKVALTGLSGERRSVSITLNHARKLPAKNGVAMEREGSRVSVVDTVGKKALFTVEDVTGSATLLPALDFEGGMKRVGLTITAELRANESQELVVKLPSPVLDSDGRATLAALDYEAARTATLRFWGDYEARGARFRVPEKAVNDLFRANLWHALRLPRRHGGEGASVRIDLPYSNFAYTQTGVPWPVNQSIYVDYMIYDLRGYHNIAAEELGAVLRDNLEPTGHIKGYANWLVYTPSTLYAVGKNYLLSQDRPAFEQLLPPSLRVMDWCLGQVREARDRSGTARGLVHGPLNDGTGVGYWAFNQAYAFAGLDLFGKALQRYGHPRAAECLAAARDFQRSVNRAFGTAAMRSPLVQLRDHTWIPYVPCEATRFGRLLDQWYPTDVDTGAVHLLRLKAVPAGGDLAESLLNDHEDNLYLHGWGMANEPVYNPQGTAYLLRDDSKAAIRTFYSMMACAFSHSVYEAVEHRWSHGQYFCPPSTDGAWAELYRNMLVHELDDDTLFLFAATPRKWLEHGKKIEIERAPTYYGRVSAHLESQAEKGKILAEIDMPGFSQPKAVVIRFRHPRGSPMRSVEVNGRTFENFDPRKEWIRIENPTARHYSIVAGY